MALPDMLIDRDVEHFINTQINKADYSTLRQYLVEKRPFAAVEKAIDSKLSQILAEQRQSSSKDALQTDTTTDMKQLKEDLLNNSYMLFIKQLEMRLQVNTGLAIYDAQRQALKQILPLMKAQQDQRNRERSLLIALANATDKLNALDLSLASHKHKLQQCQNTVAELLQTEPNPGLDDRISSLNKQVFLVELPLELNLIALLIAITLIPAMSPVSFPIMAGILGFAIVGGVMSLKDKLTELWRLHQNRNQTQTIIQKQNADIDQLNHSIIPDLNSQIVSTKQQVAGLEHELKVLAQNMPQLEQQIQAIAPLSDAQPAVAFASASAPALDTSEPLAAQAKPQYSYKAPVFFTVPQPGAPSAPDASENDFDNQPGAQGNFPAASAPSL